MSFVYAYLPALTSRCKKYKDKTKYSESAVEKAVAEFRRRKIITRCVRRRDGIERNGFIVAPHESLTACQNDRCFWDEFLPQSAEQSAECCAEQSAGCCADAVSAQANDD